MADRVLDRRVRELHHVRAGRGGEPGAAGQVRVQDVESTRAEPELARLDVDDDVVAERDRAGQLGIGDARHAVDLAANEALVPFDDRADGPAAEAKRHAPPRRAPT